MSENSKKSFEDRVVDWFYRNRLVLIGVPVAVVAVGLAVVGFNTLKSRNELKSQADLFKVEAALEKKMENILKEESADPTPTDPKDKKAAQAKGADSKKALEKTPALLQERFKIELADLARITSQYEGSNAATMAAVRLAGLAHEYKDLDLAMKTLQSAVNHVDKNAVYFGVLHGHLALVLSEQNNCKEAISHYDQILSNDKQKAFYSQSLLRKGVCHMELKDWEAATKAFDQIEKDHADTGASYSAKNFKRLVMLKQGRAGT